MQTTICVASIVLPATASRAGGEHPIATKEPIKKKTVTPHDFFKQVDEGCIAGSGMLSHKTGRKTGQTNPKAGSDVKGERSSSGSRAAQGKGKSGKSGQSALKDAVACMSDQQKAQFDSMSTTIAELKDKLGELTSEKGRIQAEIEDIELKVSLGEAKKKEMLAALDADTPAPHLKKAKAMAGGAKTEWGSRRKPGPVFVKREGDDLFIKDVVGNSRPGRGVFRALFSVLLSTVLFHISSSSIGELPEWATVVVFSCALFFALAYVFRPSNPTTYQYKLLFVGEYENMNDARPEFARSELMKRQIIRKYVPTIVETTREGVRFYDDLENWGVTDPWKLRRCGKTGRFLDCVLINTGLLATGLNSKTLMNVSKEKNDVYLERCQRMLEANSLYSEDYHSFLTSGRSCLRDTALLCATLVAPHSIPSGPSF